MDLPARQEPEALAPSAPPSYCSYCGAQLDPLFYFCLNCATPYKSIEAVVPHARPMRLTDGELIEKKAPSVAPMFWTYVAVVVGAAVLSGALFGERRPDLALVLSAVMIFTTTCVFAALYWPSLAVQFTRSGLFQPAMWLGLLALAPLLGINYLYHSWLVHEMGLKDALMTDRLREVGVSEGALVFLFCIVPAITEEVAFRGLVQHWLRVAIRPRNALILASALFTCLHFSILRAPYIFAVGLLLGWVKLKTGSLYPSMILHGLHNLAVLELFTL